MKRGLPDINRFERNVFKGRDTLAMLLSFSIRLMEPRYAGLLFGADRSFVRHLPSETWDRGHAQIQPRRDEWPGLRLFGKWIVRYKGLSPVRLYKDNIWR